MVVCGVELKGAEAIVALIESSGDIISYQDIDPRKIKLTDDESKASIRSFSDTFSAFLQAHGVEVVAIKKRAKKGNYSGGAVSFKMEGIIQLCADVDVELIAPQAISAFSRKKRVEIPDQLNQYQEQAFLTACCACK